MISFENPIQAVRLSSRAFINALKLIKTTGSVATLGWRNGNVRNPRKLEALFEFQNVAWRASLLMGERCGLVVGCWRIIGVVRTSNLLPEKFFEGIEFPCERFQSCSTFYEEPYQILELIEYAPAEDEDPDCDGELVLAPGEVKDPGEILETVGLICRQIDVQWGLFHVDLRDEDVLRILTEGRDLMV